MQRHRGHVHQVHLRLQLAIVAVLVTGCQQGESHGSPPRPVPQAAAKPATLTPGDRIVVDGIGLELFENGELRLIGKDRWGKPLDTTYENIEFLRKALPVLERSLMPIQAAKLRALVDTDAPQSPP
jgi:hypothetical protein